MNRNSHGRFLCVPSTFLGFLVNVEIECEEVFWKSFFFWQTLQQKHQLSLTQSLQPVRAKTPALSAAVWIKQRHRRLTGSASNNNIYTHPLLSSYIILEDFNFNSHVTSLTLMSRFAFRTNVRGRGPPSSNRCRIWHGAGLSSTKTSKKKKKEKEITFQITVMRLKSAVWKLNTAVLF